MLYVTFIAQYFRKQNRHFEVLGSYQKYLIEKMATPAEKLKSLKIGQVLLVETNTGELLTGTLKTVNMKYLTIELDNARDIKTNYTYQSPQLLTYNLVKSIKLLLNENDDKSHSNPSNSNVLTEKLNGCESSISNSSTTGAENSIESQEKGDGFNIQLTALDLQLLQKQLDTLTYINQTDHKYHKALSDMKSQTVIGLLIDPINMGRNCKTSLMAISTLQNIYIFDMLALGKIFNELRLILQAERPRKAVHFSHKIVDHLRYRHNVLLKGVFDTFLAYCLVANEKTNLTLEETIQKTFNISDVYFEADSKHEIPVSSYQRPLHQSQRLTVAKKVAFQLKLYDHLLHEYMLKNFYNQCEKFSETFCNNIDNFQVGQQLHSSSRAGFEHIQPNGNWKENLDFDLEFLNNQEQTLNKSVNLINLSN